jgi:bifunctional DNA-binding transcriptional regulator/antitoxin component of YhaV-PrlF toxin-antitoxin module
MPSVKITAKRQATLPLETCEALQIGPGDIVDVEPQMIGDEKVWVLRPRKKPDRSWIGSLRSQINTTDHDMDSIRRSIAEGRRKDGI